MASTSNLLSNKILLPKGPKDATIPQIHLGLYMMSGREATGSVRFALGAGYRGFDSAQWYENEREAGAAIRAFLESDEAKSRGVKREDVFYTSKLRDNSTDYDEVRESIRESVRACGLGYIDLFLLHSPLGGSESRKVSWRAVEDAVDAGEVRMGGVSNYGVRHIEELMASKPRHHPVINQIEVHPFNTQLAIREVCEKYGIVIEAYAPLVRGMRMKHPKIVALSQKYACTPAQLLVRWSIQCCFVTLPKSTRQDRIVKNAEVAGFEISAEDMDALSGLDEHLVTDWDPTNCA